MVCSRTDDYRHFILEYGPVTSSELPSTVNIVFADDSTATKGDTADGTVDYKSSAETFTIPAGAQTATVTSSTKTQMRNH